MYARDRQWAFVVALRLVRVLDWLSRFSPANAPVLGSVLERPSSSKSMTFSMNFVRVKVGITVQRRDAGLWRLYSLLAAATQKPKHLAVPIETYLERQQATEREWFLPEEGEEDFAGDAVVACMSPVCFKRKPKGVVEATNMALHVLEALEALHSLGFVHRDVRLDNIMLGPGNSGWFLVDLDEAAAMDETSQQAPWPHWALNEEAKRGLRYGGLSSDGAREDAWWTPKHDVAMLGYALHNVARASVDNENRRIEELAATVAVAGSARAGTAAVLNWQLQGLSVQGPGSMFDGL